MHSLDVAGANQGPLSLNPVRWRELMQEEGGAGGVGRLSTSRASGTFEPDYF